jgi:hypothetical protein
MTANELADKLMESNSVSWGSCTHEQHDNDKHFKEQAATMLRQQAKEIEILKKLIESSLGAFESSLQLNKAQSERYWNDCKSISR